MIIEELYKRGKLSARSFNVCRDNGLDYVADLILYYLNHKSFDKLNNCGRKSNEELISLYNEYKDFEIGTIESHEQKGNILKEVVSNLTRTQREVINSFIFINTNSLSKRSKNAISLYLDENLKIKNFAGKIFFSATFDVSQIKNVGAKSINELEKYIFFIKDFLIDISESKNEKYLIALKNNFLIQRSFRISNIPDEILESGAIFKLTDFLLTQNALFDETQTSVVGNCLKIYQDSAKVTLEDVAQMIGLTRERVRQIRNHCLNEMFVKLLFVQNFNEDLLRKYNIDINDDIIKIDEAKIEVINLSNRTRLSREFITYILFAYLSDRFLLVGNIEDVLQLKYFNTRGRHNWKNCYLVSKGIVDGFNFTLIVDDISNRLANRIEKAYSFNFKSYLLAFIVDESIDTLYNLLPIAEHIINEEFEIYLDSEENIQFKKNTPKQVCEYAFEALESLGRPSKVEVIFEKVGELNPGYDVSEKSLRGSMKRKNGFIPIGRKSIFGLKKWEEEMSDFKGGTIRSIVNNGS